MLLKSEMSGWAVQYGTGERIGTVRDMIVNTRNAHWPVTGLILTRGLARRRHLLDVPTRELTVDPHERVLVRKGHTPLADEPVGGSAIDHLRLSSIEGARVLSRDQEYLGQAYDFAIATRPLKGWQVWRFLVRAPGLKSRRLRLSVDDVDRIENGTIVLRRSRDQVLGAE